MALKGPTLTDECLSSLAAPPPPTPLIPSRSSQNGTISRDTDPAAKFTGVGAGMVKMVGSGAGIGTVFGSFIIGCAQKCSLKQQFISYDPHEGLLLIAASLMLFAM